MDIWSKDDLLADYILSFKDYEELVSDAHAVNVHWSTKIEGNKLSLEEVRESSRKITASKARIAHNPGPKQEIINHLYSYFMEEELHLPWSLSMVELIHRMLMTGTGENCVLGNSSEFKNAILLYHVQVPHYNYVGDSILGNYAHMGAGSICSNLKSDGKNIVIHGDKEIESGLRKIGAILGDYADIGCQSVLNPGTVIGQHTQVYPLSMVRGVVPENSIYKAKDNIVIKEKR